MPRLSLDDLPQLRLQLVLVEAVVLCWLLLPLAEQRLPLRQRLQHLLHVNRPGFLRCDGETVAEGDDEPQRDEPCRRDGVEEHAEDGAYEKAGHEDLQGVVIDERAIGKGMATLDVDEVVGDRAAEDSGLGERDSRVRREMADDHVHWNQDASSSCPCRGSESDGDEGNDSDPGILRGEGEEEGLVLADSEGVRALSPPEVRGGAVLKALPCRVPHLALVGGLAGRAGAAAAD
mmetsp:Transcript_3301/g.11292  ORF Transcript_3301/g.11292 Transcript_3301/m.11292 type:complete len:233 (-) Transcript_3301:420-1118(-)